MAHTIKWTQKHTDFWTRQLLALTPIEAAYIATYGTEEEKAALNKVIEKNLHE